MSDPTQSARDWLAANPDDPASIYVQAALDEAERYRRVCAEMSSLAPDEIRIVLCSVERDGRLAISLNTPSSEARIAEMVTRMWGLMQEVMHAVEADCG